MSQSAVVPEQVCLQQPFELSETVTRCRSLEGSDSSTGMVHRSSKVLCDRRTAHIAVSVADGIGYVWIPVHVVAAVTRHTV